MPFALITAAEASVGCSVCEAITSTERADAEGLSFDSLPMPSSNLQAAISGTRSRTTLPHVIGNTLRHMLHDTHVTILVVTFQAP